MKRSKPIARISLTVAAGLVLAFTTGCDQQSGQLGQISEVFQKKLTEKDKELAEAKTALQVAVSQKAEIEGKLAAMQAELDRAHAAPVTIAGGGPAISAEKLGTQIATSLEPMIRNAVKQAMGSQTPAAPGPMFGGNVTPATNPNGANSGRKPPQGNPTADVPTRPKETDTGEPKRPTGNATKIPIEFPPIEGGR